MIHSVEMSPGFIFERRDTQIAITCGNPSPPLCKLLVVFSRQSVRSKGCCGLIKQKGLPHKTVFVKAHRSKINSEYPPSVNVLTRKRVLFFLTNCADKKYL